MTLAELQAIFFEAKNKEWEAWSVYRALQEKAEKAEQRYKEALAKSYNESDVSE